MECRNLSITLVSAKNLPNVPRLRQMQVYARIFIKGSERRSCKKTLVDTVRGSNPRWNFTVDYPINESMLLRGRVILVVQLFCKRSMADIFVGEVEIQVKRLFDMGLGSLEPLTFNVKGTENGRLKISYSFGETGWGLVIRAGLCIVLGIVSSLFGDHGDDCQPCFNTAQPQGDRRRKIDQCQMCFGFDHTADRCRYRCDTNFDPAINNVRTRQHHGPAQHNRRRDTEYM